MREGERYAQNGSWWESQINAFFYTHTCMCRETCWNLLMSFVDDVVVFFVSQPATEVFCRCSTRMHVSLQGKGGRPGAELRLLYTLNCIPAHTVRCPGGPESMLGSQRETEKTERGGSGSLFLVQIPVFLFSPYCEAADPLRLRSQLRLPADSSECVQSSPM